MDLFRKVRTLLGALAHKPFEPRPDKTLLDKPKDSGQDRREGPEHASLTTQPPPVEDVERVADLIAQKRQDGADQAGVVWAGTPRAR